MAQSAQLDIGPGYETAASETSAGQKAAGRVTIAAGTLLFAATLLYQILFVTGVTAGGFSSWQPVLYAYVLWGAAFGFGQVLIRGEAGRRAVFVLPAVFFTVAMVVFPTVFG